MYPQWVGGGFGCQGRTRQRSRTEQPNETGAASHSSEESVPAVSVSVSVSVPGKKATEACVNPLFGEAPTRTDEAQPKNDTLDLFGEQVGKLQALSPSERVHQHGEVHRHPFRTCKSFPRCSEKPQETVPLVRESLLTHTTLPHTCRGLCRASGTPPVACPYHATCCGAGHRPAGCRVGCGLGKS